MPSKSLRQLALDAGAGDELEGFNFEVFAHGTIASFAIKIVETWGGCLTTNGGKWRGQLFTVPDLEVASAFARRSSQNNPREQPAVVGIAVSPQVVKMLKANRHLMLTPIQNPPEGVPASAQQWVFQPGALKELQRSAFFFLAKN